ncbi:MAG TPA: glutathionylspermidine synthase family protein [Gammaproteobacteria bacterium]|nr:glutathionylspermidine synthase family protein [Gammaproteobacteria bacterium]
MNGAPAKFGSMLGLAPGEVPAFSSHYPSADNSEFPDRESFRSYHEGIFMGYKWQCVEFARRWLYRNKGYIFDEVGMAYDIFHLRNVRVIRDNSLLPVYSFRNGSRRRPEPGCLLIWEEGGEFERTGHVAVVTAVLKDRIRIVEQNVDDRVWPDERNYARELILIVDEDGGHHVQCTFEEGTILGWVIQTEDPTHAEPRVDPEPELFDLALQRMPASRQQSAWLDGSRAEEAAFLLKGGARLTSIPGLQSGYFTMSESAAAAIKHATNELHAMFMHATHQVMRSDALLSRFNLPRSIWPKLKQSWNNRRNQMITGRFDFAVSSAGIKVYEYNADSASCYLETARLQGAWFDAYGYDEGRCPGERLNNDLIGAWRKSGVDTVLHIMQDDEPEETYHASFMQSVAAAAGIRNKIILGTHNLGWDAEGFVVDQDGERILQVWKTWAWETVLNQLRAECDDDEALAAIGRQRPRRAAPPRLIDVLLRSEVMVYEPLWTLIPSNKAILPILNELFPDHPRLLRSAYELNGELEAMGYAVKPIAGRCGANISMVDAGRRVVGETSGQFARQECVYQELFRLPVIDGLSVQIGAFTVDGKYSAACVRVDHSPVITSHSDLLPLRILENEDFLCLNQPDEKARSAG